VIPALEPIFGKEVKAAASDGFTSGVSGAAWAAAAFLALGAVSTLGLGSAADRKKKAKTKV
jgi:hypothetical protein